MDNQIIFSRDITSGDVSLLNSNNNVLLTSRPSLNQLTNVDIDTPNNNQVLAYSSVLDKWVNSTGAGGGSLTGLTDVAIVAPVEGDALTYNAITSNWVNSVIANKTELNQLDDVNITTPTNGQYLQYDTSTIPAKWINITPSYLSYSVNGYPLNTLFTAQTNFSIIASSTFNTTPTPVINYDFSNNISLSTTTGLISGLINTKTYKIEISISKAVATGVSGVHTISLLDDVIGTGAVIVSNQMWNSNSLYHIIHINTIISGYTKICPVLRFGSASYTGVAQNYAYNATINIREL